MRSNTVRLASALALATFLAACGDARLDKLTLGISKDSAAALIGEAPHRSFSLITAGKIWEIQLYARSSVAAGDSLPWRAMSPVVFIDHQTVGWGWSWWGKEAAKQGIVMPAK
jgi:hypothetical protein